MKKQSTAPGIPIELRMSATERDLILAETFMDPEYMERLVPVVGKPLSSSASSRSTTWRTCWAT
ncbi:MAG: hypothetical protein GY926_13325 [bacterium]|nr:hypothetical protein [bacterium]